MLSLASRALLEPGPSISRRDSRRIKSLIVYRNVLLDLRKHASRAEVIVIKVRGADGEGQPHAINGTIIFIISLLRIETQLDIGKNNAPDEKPGFYVEI